MNLAPNFTLAEMRRSDLALRHGIDNEPPPDVVGNLRDLAVHVLQPIRDHFDAPVIVSSGYRCLELNTLCGSKIDSQHTKGQAADFEVLGVPNVSVARWVRDCLDFDQACLEFWDPNDPSAGWVHVSYVAGKNRKQPLTITTAGIRLGLPEV